MNENEIRTPIRKLDPSVQLEEGLFEGWEIMIKVATNGLGKMVVVGQDATKPLFGPTDDPQAVADFLTEYVTEE